MPMQIDLKKISAELKKKLKTAEPINEVSDAGVISFCGDGIILADGLMKAKYYEVLQIENGSKAIALNLEEKQVGAVVLNDEFKVSLGMGIKTTGKLMEVPVGESLLGRVIDPLGNPVDGKGELVTSKFRPVEAAAPAIIDRGKVNTPLQTGILSIDSMIPIGKGQRELIIGDRQTGKTAIALDTIINQKGKNVICIYVAIGQKTSLIAEIVQKLKEHNALDYTVIVSSTAKDSAPVQYLAPYSGCAVAEEFMYGGKDVLIVYDDLSKHAVAYRTLSLLLRRPAGREAYPGDIFYLHSRLLERSGKLSQQKGGGSITALPIVETLAGDISAYIPTNVISITDGQIFLETELFRAGVRPAVNVGLSVSRVGGSAQTKAMRAVAGTLRLELAQYRELVIFTQFGSDLDAITKKTILKGEKLTELLKQPQYSPLELSHQVTLLYAVTCEQIKQISAKAMQNFAHKFLHHIDRNYAEIFNAIDRTGQLDDQIKTWIETALDEYIPLYVQSH